MTKFVDDNILDIWWDKNMTAGYDFWEQIDFHIENRDIICLFISANYLASKHARKKCEEHVNYVHRMEFVWFLLFYRHAAG